MDHDQIATADLAEVYFDDFDGNLVMACSYGHKLRATCAIPDQITADGEHEFYMMGPILNLLAARKEGLWERLLERHRQIGSDEQKSLVAATGGRLKVLEKRWNRVVYLGNLDRDYRELFPSVKRPETDWFENYGVLHFTGGPKPWWAEEVEAKPKKKERVWFKEYATWAKLRRGDWAVPEGCRRLSVD
jgi:lipopolysaccharide biosynthesis glycosyltransferase